MERKKIRFTIIDGKPVIVKRPDLFNSKNISSIWLMFQNNNNRWLGRDDNNRSKGIEGNWSGQMTFRNDNLESKIEFQNGSFNDVVKQMKENLK